MGEYYTNVAQKASAWNAYRDAKLRDQQLKAIKYKMGWGPTIKALGGAAGTALMMRLLAPAKEPGQLGPESAKAMADAMSAADAFDSKKVPAFDYNDVGESSSFEPSLSLGIPDFSYEGGSGGNPITDTIKSYAENVGGDAGNFANWWSNVGNWFGFGE